MRRPFRRWFASIAANLISGLIVLSGPHIGIGGELEDARNAGTAIGDSALERFGTAEAIRQNIAVPMSSEDEPMTTLDGTGRFTARLLCPSSSRFLEVLVQPSATGDIAALLIAQDLDMDGTADASYTVPFPVSGICANGVIGCRPGT